MTITTSRGGTFEADWAAPGRTGLHIRLDDPRPLSLIAADFDGVDRLSGERGFDGPFLLTAVFRDPRSGRVTLTLGKEA